ncbi:MAG: hypothetical protein WD942_01225, partial [Dehalococcoidia bacterium]
MRRIDLVSASRFFFIGSGIAVVLSLVLLAYPGLRPGIEFTAGTTTLIRFETPVQQDALRTAYASLGRSEALIQSTGANEYLIRTGELEVPEGSFTEVSPDAAPSFDGIGPSPLEEVGTLTLGASAGATDDIGLYLPADGDVCTPGEVVTSQPAGTQVSVVEQILICPAPVYRVLVDGQ